MSEAPDPQALLRSREYLRLLALAAIIGVPVSAVAYGFLKLAAELQHAFYESIPKDLGLDPVPVWWPAPLLVLGGLLVALAILRLPGTGGHSPADGFHAGGGPLPPEYLPGVFLAALGTLAFGAVLGPEAPLIGVGSGLGALAMRLAKRDAPPRAAAVIAAAGSFAAISALVGSPLIGAVLLLEAAGLGGQMAIVLLLPGLLAAGIGDLIFLGLDSLTGFGTFSLTIPGLPPFDHLTGADFLYALLIGGAAPFVGRSVRRVAIALRARVEPRMIMLMPLVGLAIAGIAILFHAITGKDVSMVLFSGQDQLPELLGPGAGWSAAVIVAIIVAKSLAYALSLSCFRGGPIFPAVFIGAAGGLAASHLPGLDMVPAVAMGVGAMSCTMLELPISSTMLATLLLGKDGLEVTPVVIVAVAVAYIVTAWLTPQASDVPAEAPAQARPAPV